MRSYADKGHFRFIYLLFNHSISGVGFWIRSGCITKSDGRRYKQQWFTFFNRSAPDENFGIKRVKYEVSSIVKDITKIRHLEGTIEWEGRMIKWNILINPVSHLHHHIPSIFYTLPFPATKVVSYPVVVLNGTIDINGKVFHLKDEKGCLGSIWGSNYEKAWAYFHCNSFTHNDGFIEGVSGSIVITRNLIMRPFMFVISADKETFRFNRLRDLFFNGCRWEKGRIVFWRKGLYTRIYGELRCRDQDIIAGIYDDTDDTYVYCYHTEVGDCSVVIEKRRSIGSPWNILYRLASTGLCHFEYGSMKSDQSLRYVYEMIQ